MASGPPIRRRVPPRTGPSAGLRRRVSARPEPESTEPSGSRRRLVVGAVIVVVILTALGMQIRSWRGPRQPPAEVETIAQVLRTSRHDVERIAENTNGGWSVLFDDGEIQWFRSPSAAEARLHPVRISYGLKHDPNIVVTELHATVFVIVMSGRRQGSTLELGTARTSADQITALVRTAVSGPGR